MKRADIQKALEEAKALTNHTEFVVAGSLSVLGWAPYPPEAMSMSIDIDFFMLGDPQRSAELSAHLGEGSDFHIENGYYLDPITPELPTLPNTWRNRVKPVRLGEVNALFLDVNDTAISKYVRGDENDFRWIEAGYRAGILDADVIKARMEFDTNFHEVEEKRAAMSRLRLHRLALRPDGSLSDGLLTAFARHRELLVKDLDTDQGCYRGQVVWTDGNHLIQSLSEAEIGVHVIVSWRDTPKAGDVVTIGYSAEVPEWRRDGEDPSLA